MKKLFLLLAFMIGALTVQAADYTYLTFETTDGAKVSVEASSLTITISGTTLTAGSQKFTLSNLSKMYFSTSDETTGIKAIKSEESKVKSCYTLDGRIATDSMKGIMIQDGKKFIRK